MTGISAQTRRNNLVTLILLMVFAIGLCATVFVSMRVHARRLHEQQQQSGLSSSY